MESIRDRVKKQVPVPKDLNVASDILQSKPKSTSKRGRPLVSSEKKKVISVGVYPTKYHKAKSLAAKEGLSFAELIDKLLTDYIAKSKG